MQGKGAVGLGVSASSDLHVEELRVPARCSQDKGPGKREGMQKRAGGCVSRLTSLSPRLVPERGVTGRRKSFHTSQSALRGARKSHFPIVNVRGASLGAARPASRGSRYRFCGGTPPTSWLGESVPPADLPDQLAPRRRGQDPSSGQDPADPARGRALNPVLRPRPVPGPSERPPLHRGPPLPELPGPWGGALRAAGPGEAGGAASAQEVGDRAVLPTPEPEEGFGKRGS